MRLPQYRRVLATAVLSIGAGLTLSATLVGQTVRPAATLEDLLEEVRGIRRDVAQASAASLRMQALVARVSLQEQRLKALGERLAAAQRALDDAVAGRMDKQRRLDALEVTPDEPVSEDMRKEMAVAAAVLRREVAAVAAREERLRGTVSELSGYIQTEEGRWAEFNQRLDDLDRPPSAAPR